MARKPPHNPLEADPHREHRIRERAYLMWEAEGKPHGRDIEYWERARELVGMEESAGSGLLPNPMDAARAPRQADIGEADIQDNLGEFPGLMTDQGDVPVTAAPKRKTRSRTKKTS